MMADDPTVRRIADRQGTSMDAVRAMIGEEISQPPTYGNALHAFLVPFAGTSDQVALVCADHETRALTLVDAMRQPDHPSTWIPITQGFAVATAVGFLDEDVPFLDLKSARGDCGPYLDDIHHASGFKSPVIRMIDREGDDGA